VRVGAILEVLAAILTGAAVTASIAGPLRFEIFGSALSIRTLSRPLVAAAVLFAARAWLARGPDRLSDTIAITARTALGAIATAGVLGWLTFLSSTCGGADSYGYVSASERLLALDLVQPEPLAKILPFPDPMGAATPLGYTPSVRVENATAPIYALGLPAIMATATLVAGEQGPFLVAPVMGVLLMLAVLIAAWTLCRDRLVALTAMTLTAVHPVVFTYSIQPMSDVPAAAFFLLALATLLTSGARGARRARGARGAGATGAPLAPLAPLAPFTAGLAAALCLFIRPVLAPALASLAIMPSIQSRRLDIRSAVLFAIPLTLAVTLQLSLHWYLYGHPFAVAYAPVQTLFSIERVGVNARSHGYWAWMTLGPLFLGVAAVGVAVTSTATRVAAALVTSVVALPYLAFLTFDHWESLRFLLPALVVLTIPAAAGLVAVSRWTIGPRWGALVVVALVVVLASSWMSWLRVNQVFTMPEHEVRHRLAGELVRQSTPDNAVILAQQHHGSIRYYARRWSIGWDRIPAGALPATVASLRASGYPVYLLIDSALERTLFEARHGSLSDWPPSGQRRSVQLLEAPRDVRSPP
jgi:hypothetical protein